MPDSSAFPKLVLALGLVMALGFGLTTYTSPILGAAKSGELAGLIHRALGDSVEELPSAAAEIPVVTVTPAPTLDKIELERDGAATAPQPAAWVAAAARADSAALRGWLGRLVVMTSKPLGDTVFATYRRLLPGRGCPPVSHLWTATVRSTRQLVRVRGDCPAAE